MGKERNSLDRTERTDGRHADTDGGVLCSRDGKEAQEGANGREYGEENETSEAGRVENDVEG